MRIMDEACLGTLKRAFRDTFGREPQHYFSAPGRTEICGNHTDHQRGRVLAAAVDLDAVAAVCENGSRELRVKSQGYEMCVVRLDELGPRAGEENTTLSLIRGVAAGFANMGAELGGLDIYVSSRVIPGSGLSSSAAFEVLMGTILNHLFLGGKVPAPQVARIAQWAENEYFGKPCGLMDQMASAVGNLVTIDFFDPENPVVEPISFDFSLAGHALCIIDSGASHADLTDEYAAIPHEMKAISGYFGKEVLSQIPEESFYEALPGLREKFGDRALLRAIHFYGENRRVPAACQALREGDFDGFLSVIRESGRSSFMFLQNITPAGAVRDQSMAVTLALCERYLEGKGACRVHGGGFAGTCQAFVPFEKLETFRRGIDAALGQGACQVLSIRPEGGVKVEVEP